MAKKSDKKQKGFSIYKLFGKIGDILFIPILVISLFSSVSMLVQRKQNKPTSIFGISLVNILSSSMVDAGFKKGDTVITSHTNAMNIEIGDIVAFYNYKDNIDSSTQKHIIVRCTYNSGPGVDFENIEGNPIEKNNIISSLVKTEREKEKSIQDAQKSKAKIYFHYVIGIYYDDYGNVFYKTKGTNNNSADTILVRSDFVVGEYVTTPRFIRDTMSFCASMQGMIIMVCFPLSLLVLFQCFSLIKQIEIMNYEKQLITGKRKFYDEEIVKNFNGNDMEIYNKVLLYYKTNEHEKNKVLNFMWSGTLEKEKPSKKEQKLLDTLQSANNKLEKSNKQYWEEWINNTKGYTRKRIKKYYEEDAMISIIVGSNKKDFVNKTQLNSQNTNADSKTRQNEEQLQKTIQKVSNQKQDIQAKPESAANQLKNQQTTKQEQKSTSTKTTSSAGSINKLVKQETAKTPQKSTSNMPPKPVKRVVGSDENKEIKKTPIITNTTTTVNNIVKPKVGRPKKVEISETLANKEKPTKTLNSKELNSKTSTIVKKETKENKEVLNKTKKAPTASVLSEQVDQKRKVGRPKKVEEKIEEESTLKPKVGRPKKQQITQVSETKPKVGRPKKKD